MSVLTKVFGDANKRFLNKLAEDVSHISALEAKYAALSDIELRAQTDLLKKGYAAAYSKIEKDLQALEDTIRMTLSEDEKNRLKREHITLANTALDALISDAFALVREASRRTLQLRHFDVQLMGGIVLHQGQVAEMKTGEGKTLMSTLAIYVNALTGKGVHVVTVNDYLARRDAIWMGQIFNFLGLSVGIIIHDASYLYDPTATTPTEDEVRDQGVKIEMDYLKEVDRKAAYSADITYGTNNEFGFDYLRDNMVPQLDQKVQRKLHYAIIDEVDSILIDEARTPLIISAPDAKSTDRYYQFAQIVEGLKLQDDYVVDEKDRAATLTEGGIAKVENILGVENIYVEEGIQTVHHIEQALKAKTLFQRDKDYAIKDGEVIIVDEFTGRMLPGRRYSEGLHQAIEAKEGLTIQRESKTMATITFQNYFRLYDKIAGMTGTAETEAEELAKIYNLDVTTIPTNKNMIRKDLSDRIYKSEAGKFRAVVEEIKMRHATGQPVLVGTISIEKNEFLGSLLEHEGLHFNILNAKQHEREAETIAQAGSLGAITIATNIAGRGVDIKLGGSPFNQEAFEKVVALGGLHVLGTERHESRRIDNQLRGRAGRQGEPGSTQFYVSLEDDLMRIFGAERVKAVMKSWPEDMPIENGFISKSIESAQKRVEGHNFDIRKHLVEYDDVINKQRTFVYTRRDQILALGKEDADLDPQKLALEEIKGEVEDIVYFHTQTDDRAGWKVPELLDALRILLQPTKVHEEEYNKALSTGMPAFARENVLKLCTTRAEERLQALSEQVQKQLISPEQPQPFHEITKTLMLRSIDMLWVEHLETINYLRTGIGLRGYGQRDPLVEYKRESKDLFNRLLADIRKQFVYSLMSVTVGTPTKPVAGQHQHVHLHEQKSSLQAFSDTEEPERQKVVSKVKDEQGHKIGRNDPCFCGSGKKYKKCHGA